MTASGAGAGVAGRPHGSRPHRGAPAPPGGWVRAPYGAVEAAGAGGRTTAHSATAAAATARRVGRVTRNAAEAGRGYRQAGSRIQLPLRPRAGTTVGRARNLEAAARKVALGLAKRSDVVAAYWDGGLGRLVVQPTQDAVTECVVDRATELAADRRLERVDEEVLETAHPGRTGSVRAQAIALGCDAVQRAEAGACA